MGKLDLPSVTLVCMSCLDVGGAIRSLDLCRAQCDFGEVVLLTSLPTEYPYRREIPPVESYEALSHFYVKSLYAHVRTPHLLLVEPDGWICDASKWNPDWLSYDYVGGNARWTEKGPGGKGGNGGFALHSRRLLALAAQLLSDREVHPCDVALSALPSYRNGKRPLFESHGMRFAARAVQQNFSIDDGVWRGSFGHHKCANKLAEFGLTRVYR